MDGSPTQPGHLALDLAYQRLREEDVRSILKLAGVIPGTYSEGTGQTLFLSLSPSAIQDLSDTDPNEADLERVLQEDLTRAAGLFVTLNSRGDLQLRIYTRSYCLVAIPARPAWIVRSLKANTGGVRSPLRDLPWRIVEPTFPHAKPLPIWLLALADFADEIEPKQINLHYPDESPEERGDSAMLRTARERLPKSLETLNDAFSLLDWSHEVRRARTWAIEITPIPRRSRDGDRQSYVITKGTNSDWPSRLSATVPGPHGEARVVVVPDPDSPSRWLLHGPANLESALELTESGDRPYARQAKIVDRLSRPALVRLEDVPAAATQIPITDEPKDVTDVKELPGELPWEPRQAAAIKLALAEHPVCAIKGPPGTGKSTVIVSLVRRAIHAGRRVLLVAPTHVALDEVLGRIHELKLTGAEINVVPARVAPEGRAAVRGELEVYIAGRIGSELAYSAANKVRERLRALPADQVFETKIAELNADLELLQGFKDLKRAQQENAEDLRRRIDKREKAIAQASQARERYLASETLHQQLSDANDKLTMAADIFAPHADVHKKAIENEARAAEELRDDEARLQDRNEALARATEAYELASETLERARAAELRWEPTTKITRIADRLFSTHARAANRLTLAEQQEIQTDLARQSLAREVQLGESAVSGARARLQKAKRDKRLLHSSLESLLAGYRELIVGRGKAQPSDWVQSLPELLAKATKKADQSQRKAKSAVEEARRELDSEDASVLEASEAHQRVDARRSALQIQLAELVRQLDDRGLAAATAGEDLSASLESKRARVVADFEKNRRTRLLLEKWQLFYAREDIEETATNWALASVNLVAATTQGIASSFEFKNQRFDLLICDESSRVTRGELLVPATRADRVVLVGDEKQLPPFVSNADEQTLHAMAALQLSQTSGRSLIETAQTLCDEWNLDEPEFRAVRVAQVAERASDLANSDPPAWPDTVQRAPDEKAQIRRWREIADALTRSCFDHALAHLRADQVVRLCVQRRMPASIADLVSAPVYGGDYQSPSESRAAPPLSSAFRQPWQIINTQHYCAAKQEFREQLAGTGFINPGEARAVVLALREFKEAASRTGTALTQMVITFYLAQARHIEKLVESDPLLRGDRIPILPIDRCQGREADAVVVSFVRTLRNPPPNAGRWLLDQRRLNVALTRARKGLVLVGNLRTLGALRGDSDGERLLGHLVQLVEREPQHQILQFGNL